MYNPCELISADRKSDTITGTYRYQLSIISCLCGLLSAIPLLTKLGSKARSTCTLLTGLFIADLSSHVPISRGFPSPNLVGKG